MVFSHAWRSAFGSTFAVFASSRQSALHCFARLTVHGVLRALTHLVSSSFTVRARQRNVAFVVSSSFSARRPPPVVALPGIQSSAIMKANGGVARSRLTFRPRGRPRRR